MKDIKILYIDMNKLIKNDIVWGLVELGIDVERYDRKVPIDGIDYDEVELLYRELNQYDLVVSQNFSSTIAEACHKKHIPYVSWIYDAPQSQSYNNEAGYDECYLFNFDRNQQKRLKEAGVKHVYHQPLAANVTKTSALNISDEDIRRFSSDLSFVGTMYKTTYYNELYNGMPLSMREHFDKVIASNFCLWNGNSIYNQLEPMELEAIYKIMNKEGLAETRIPLAYLIESLMFPVEISGRERKALLNEASKICDVAVYTRNPDIFRNELMGRVYPPVDSETDLYKVYYSSKINLNVSLHSIESGIPQRVFDIMSVGGFVLSNYQAEIEELFEVDKEIVTYRSMDDYMDKVKYYLAHEEQRIRIGINGYLKVRDNYTYPIILEKILNLVCKDWGIG